jgi:WD40 repeat protein
LNRFEGHTGGVNAVAFSSDGERIISGSSDKTIQVWDTETGDLISGPFKGHTGSVTTLVFSPDDKHIASGSTDHTIRVWDTESGSVVVGPFTHTSTGQYKSGMWEVAASF